MGVYRSVVSIFQDSRVRVREGMLTPTLTNSLPFWGGATCRGGISVFRWVKPEWNQVALVVNLF